jgi:hypothetical protein
MMDDAMDGAMDDADAEDETDDVVSQARAPGCGECAARCAGRAASVARRSRRAPAGWCPDAARCASGVPSHALRVATTCSTVPEM